MDILASRLLQHGPTTAKSFKLSTLQHRLTLPLHIPKPGGRSTVSEVPCYGVAAKGISVVDTTAGRHTNPHCDHGVSIFNLAHAQAVTNELDLALPSLRCPDRLSDTMRYYKLAGRKRTCAMVVIACCELVGGTASAVLPAACALEMIFNASLIHDDMPCMDDAALRRGIPSCHVAFGEPAALLAGDALVALAFEHVTRAGGIPANLAVRVIAELARLTGVGGIATGQVVDMENEGTANHAINLSTLEYIHEHKAGRVLEVAAMLGAIVGGGSDGEVERLRRYGYTMGLLFQVLNDVLDVTGMTEVFRKETGKDAAAGKCTYARLMGVEGARAYIDELVARAEAELEGFDAERAAPLRHLPQFAAYRWKQPTSMRET